MNASQVLEQEEARVEAREREFQRRELRREEHEARQWN